jgi:membrane associated rhomboid family serine protease
MAEPTGKPRLPHCPLVLLIGLMVLIFLGQYAAGWNPALLLGTQPAHVAAALERLMAGELAVDALAQVGTLFTATLIHGGVEHILYNMAFLWIFASLVSQALGYRWMFAIFLLTGIAGNVVQCALNWDSPIPILGASGAVMGFEGVYLGLFLRFPLRDPDIWPLAHAVPPTNLLVITLFGAVMDIGGLVGGEGGIAFGAHLGGLVAGLFIGSFVVGRVRGEALR